MGLCFGFVALSHRIQHCQSLIKQTSDALLAIFLQVKWNFFVTNMKNKEYLVSVKLNKVCEFYRHSKNLKGLFNMEYTVNLCWLFLSEYKNENSSKKLLRLVLVLYCILL